MKNNTHISFVHLKLNKSDVLQQIIFVPWPKGDSLDDGPSSSSPLSEQTALREQTSRASAEA